MTNKYFTNKRVNECEINKQFVVKPYIFLFYFC